MMMNSSPEELSGDLDGGSIKKSMAMMLSNPAASQWLKTRRENIKPWSSFIATSRFKAPQSAGQASKRIIKNIETFQSNYLFVFIGLIVYCLVTSPLLLIAVAASLGLCYIISLKNADSQLRIFGHSLSLAQQYAVVALISFPLFFLAGAGTAVFWVLGVSFVLITLHAVMYRPEEESSENETFELITETV